MKGFISKLLLLGIIAAAIIGYFVWEGRISAVEKVLSDQMKVPVTIDDISIGFTGVTVSGLEIGVQAGSKLEKSLYTKEIAITASPSDVLFGDQVVIQEILVKNPQVGVELFDASGSDNNWTRITNNMAPAGEADPEAKQALIKHLLITDIEIRAVGGAMGTTPKTATIKEPFELHDVGGDKPLPYGKIVALITKALMKHISVAQVFEGLGSLTKGIKDIGVEGIKTPVKILEKVLPIPTKTPVPPVEGAEEGGSIFDRVFD
jgi:hypothetical protein